MKATKFFWNTYKENPSNGDSVNHTLLIKAGFIHQSGNGLFSFLPLGLRVIKKIEKIVRQEMDKIGANEMIVPYLSPRKLWDKSGRWQAYGPELIRISDRKKREYALIPTAEVDFLNIVDRGQNSYKDFPVLLYQISDKFRDELRPRFGLLRSRQFIMKDAYSFHSSEDSLDSVFEMFKEAYIKIFKRLKFDFKVCEADQGAIGGRSSFEFIVLTDSGEAEIIYCDCGYAANVEKATDRIEYLDSISNELREVHTPKANTMEEVAKYLGTTKDRGLKSLVVKMNEKYYLTVIRGDRELNESKLIAHFSADNFSYATDEELKSLKLFKGSIGPIGTKLIVVADEEIVKGSYSCGANKRDHHYTYSEYGRDWKADHILDIRTVREGDGCTLCDRRVKSMKGIEVGHIFKIGNRYSESLNSKYVDEKGVKKDILISSYGIGISRVLAALVEQNSDDRGIVLPREIAPFEIAIAIANISNEEQKVCAEKIYNLIKEESENGIDVLLDDRPLSLGYKMKDLELIGVPFIVLVGNNIKDGKVEIKSRTGERTLVEISKFKENFLKRVFDNKN